nr:ArsR family transcriptional regulator [Haladaptatus sp. YSMS36]
MTDAKRSNLIADIVGHPTGTPSVEELDYMNPPLSQDAIRRHLTVLCEVDVLSKIEFEPGDRVREYPYQFYQLTSAARRLFDQNDLFPEAAWKRQYESVEKTARIRDIESMPRPDHH